MSKLTDTLLSPF